ncbi:hypothetical protein GDO86_002640 [Hymenochirus boettgeri]|uniref:Uncharacterized protein n=1 Tax=Hymenochirus boettgeri TaxID=247094 RepID=A0A8T2JY07_9PIPI|nr:hypothetical protein GDO86_002640 [Hymenochirus boettgeri]
MSKNLLLICLNQSDVPFILVCHRQFPASTKRPFDIDRGLPGLVSLRCFSLCVLLRIGHGILQFVVTCVSRGIFCVVLCFVCLVCEVVFLCLFLCKFVNTF